MGMLVNGAWRQAGLPASEAGRFMRKPTTFRQRISADGSTPFPAEAGRYHLYVSLACPWAHRTLIVRKLLGLEAAITLSIVDPRMGEEGWTFDPEGGAQPGTLRDVVNGRRHLREVYLLAQADFTGRVTVPVLWDKTRGTIVNNESREIIRMFSTALAPLGHGQQDLWPQPLRAQVDETIEAIYEPVNNGVYRAGFARSQAAYDEAVNELFAALDHWDAVLARQRYLCGAVPTEADVCFFTTLVRFDEVYHGHFKCNRRRIVDYAHLWPYLRDLYQLPGVAETVDMAHIREHYYWSHESINPTRLVAVGPDLDFNAPHGREGLGG